MKKLILICLLAFAAPGQELSNLHPLKGSFKNQNSEFLTDLQMIFKNEAGTEITTFSDINGDFNVRLAPGRYELTVSPTISEKFVAFINIQENGLNPDFIAFIVETDPNLVALCPKIINFVKPIYPQAARAVRAMGSVVVETKVDKAGNVVSAKAVSGHPLLRRASEQAVLKSTFEPSENDDEREARLTFIFVSGRSGARNIKRYIVPCQMEVVDDNPPLIAP